MIDRIVNFSREILTRPEKCATLMALIFIAECALNLAIVSFVPYTEIDWKAYMQEVEGYLNGSTNYFDLKGDTGPLVYPGGFVYLYSLLYHVTDNGTNVQLGQTIFALLYLLQLAIVFLVYLEVSEPCNFPPWMCIFMSLTGYRVHSIFALRLFNDGPASILVWLSFLFLLKRNFPLASLFYSLSVSIKMNNLLFAPALGVIFVRNLSLCSTIGNLFICAIVQLAAGFEFLITYPAEYVSRAFEFSRKFQYKWTVNFKFLSEELFLDSRLHLALLAAHLGALVLFCAKKWLPKKFGTRMAAFPLAVMKTLVTSGKNSTCSTQMLTMLFTSNFIGMCFARSLHYQFYVWYYHSIPLLIHCCNFRWFVSVLIFVSIELCWNVYPQTVLGSAVLVSTHFFLLFRLYIAPMPGKDRRQKKNK